MRIAHVVTYISPDGAFGGPVRVALGQAEELAARGHEVTVYAASPPDRAGTSEQNGYLLRTFPARRVSPRGGFAMMSSPALTRALKEDLPRIDVGHVHLARDLVTVPAGRAIRSSGVRYVLQPHGMIDASDRLLAKPLDALATRPLLRNAHSVLVLTQREAVEISRIESRAATRQIANGVKISELPTYQDRPETVLFLARLHRRKRPLAFVEMAELLMERHPHLYAVLVGPDEGEADAVLRAIASSAYRSRIRWIGPVSPEETHALMAEARVYVLPAEGEVFPMSILEAFQSGTPVVTTTSLGIAESCQSYGAAKITDGSPAELAAAVSEILIDRELAEQLRQGGRTYVHAELDISTVADQLEAIYGSADPSAAESAGNAWRG